MDSKETGLIRLKIDTPNSEGGCRPKFVFDFGRGGVENMGGFSWRTVVFIVFDGEVMS